MNTQLGVQKWQSNFLTAVLQTVFFNSGERESGALCSGPWTDLHGRQAGFSFSLLSMVCHGALCVSRDVIAPEASGITCGQGVDPALSAVAVEPSQLH